MGLTEGRNQRKFMKLVNLCKRFKEPHGRFDIDSLLSAHTNALHICDTWTLLLRNTQQVN